MPVVGTGDAPQELMDSPAPPPQPARNQPHQTTKALPEHPPAKITCSCSLLQQDHGLLCSSHTHTGTQTHPVFSQMHQ